MEVKFGHVQAFLMYLAVFRGYKKYVTKNGPFTMYIPSPAFFYDMEVGEKIHFEIPGASVAEAENAFDDGKDSTPVTIEPELVGPLAM